MLNYMLKHLSEQWNSNWCFIPSEHISGLVSLYPATKEVGGLTVIPDSHKQFEAIGHRLYSRNPSRWGLGDYISMPRDEPVLQDPAIIVQCQAGDLLLWDSRTVHCNSPGSLSPSELSSHCPLVRADSPVPEERTQSQSLSSVMYV